MRVVYVEFRATFKILFCVLEARILDYDRNNKTIDFISFFGKQFFYYFQHEYIFVYILCTEYILKL